MAYLEIESTEGKRRVPLNRDRLSIGRLSYNDVMLASPQISRQHAELRCIDGQWWIADLNSTNGLHLNGTRIQKHLLTDGDEIALAPNIIARFVKEPGDARTAQSDWSFSSFSSSSSSNGKSSFSPATSQPSEPDWVAFAAQYFSTSGQIDPQAQRNTHPIHSSSPAQPFPPTAQRYPAVAPSSSGLAPLAPRSIYADDEEPFIPPGLAAPLPIMFPPTITPAPMPVRPALPIQQNESTSSVPPPYDHNEAPPTFSNPRMNIAGYPAPQGPLQSGGDQQDPYHRSGPSVDRSGLTGNNTLLHVCQTCGQLTAPDAVYCQNCHHSIAHECSNCRLSLLPIQDRCPRCHTPNEASVRRAHPGR